MGRDTPRFVSKSLSILSDHCGIFANLDSNASVGILDCNRSPNRGVFSHAGCIADNGETFENGAVWEKDPCVTCRCDDGEVFCQSEMCGVRCSHPRKVPGHCCPVCDGESRGAVSGQDFCAPEYLFGNQ